MKGSPLLVIFLTVFIDLLGFGIVIPVLPTLVTVGFPMDATTMGMIMASFSLMQMIATPIWGRLSDRIGRRPVILGCLAATAGSYVLFGFATSVAMLFVARIIAGIGAGSIAAAQAYISDVTAPEERAKGMGLIGMAFGLGFVFGPTLGGILMHESSYHLPMFVAAGLSTLATLLAYFALPEPKSAEARAAHAARQQPFLTSLAKTAKEPVAAGLILFYFFITFAIANIYGSFTLICLQDWGLTVAQNGYLYGYIGLIGAAMQGGGVRVLIKRMSEPRIFTLGSIIMMCGLGLLPFSGGRIAWIIGALTFVAVGNGMNMTAALSLLSKNTSPAEQGGVLGTNMALSSLARALGPMWGNFSYQSIGHAVPFLTGAGVVGGVLVSSSAFLARLSRGRPAPSRPASEPAGPR